MSKANGTAASQAHAPEKKHTAVSAHAYKFPGVKTGKKEKVVEGASHDAGALARGKKLSMGHSANGSTHGVPSSYDYVGHDGYNVAKDAPMASSPAVAARASHDAAELAAAKGNSMGASADGSHKGLPSDGGMIQQ
jgi:hypothetical protein